MKVSELIDLLDKTEMLFKQTNAMLEAVEKHRTLANDINDFNSFCININVKIIN